MLITEWDTEKAKEVWYEEGLEEGLEKGRKEGREEERKEGREEIARNALAEGASIEFVRKITGLDIEAIHNLKKKM